MTAELEHADNDPNFDSRFLESQERLSGANHWTYGAWPQSPPLDHNSKFHEPIYVPPKDESIAIGSEDLNFEGINS